MKKLKDQIEDILIDLELKRLDIKKAEELILKLLKDYIKGVIPEKKDWGFDDEPYCKSCRSSETFCQCKGFNQAIDEMNKNLEKSEDI